MGGNTRCTKNRDIISNLPDGIIGHILSCLPTKDAVRTSVLSKKWEYKWNFIYNIRVKDREHFSKNWSEHDDEAHFPNFMDLLLVNSRNLKSFRLRCSRRYDASRIRTWLSTAFRRNVEIVDVSSPCQYAQDSIILSRSLLHCTSLRSLDLVMCCTLKVSVKICFMNLTCLKLRDVQIANDNSGANTLTFDFPVLETLELFNCNWWNVSVVELCAPVLCSFALGTDYITEYDDNCTIKILGARILKFTSFGNILTDLILNGSAVVCASLENTDYREQNLGKAGLQIRKLLKEFSSIEELELSCFTVKPSLLDGEDEYDYKEMEYVPSCIVSQLEEVKINGFGGHVPELDLARFLLEKGAKLKKLTVLCLKWCRMGKEDVAMELSKLPKASALITVVVT